MKPKSPKSPTPMSPRRSPEEGLPPLRRPRDLVDGTTGGTGTPTAAKVMTPTMKPIKPNIIRHGPERALEDALPSADLAAPSLVPKLSRADYYSNPSVDTRRNARTKK
eukprot:g11401.t1